MDRITYINKITIKIQQHLQITEECSGRKYIYNGKIDEQQLNLDV